MTGRLTINLSALAHNYAQFHRGSPAQFAAVVKADSYGLGVEAVAKKLWLSYHLIRPKHTLLDYVRVLFHTQLQVHQL